MGNKEQYIAIDTELLDLYKKNPEAAFKQMFDTYYMQLCVYAVQLGDSFELAEDIVQNTLLYFWEKKYYRKIESNLRNYLFHAVRNALLTELKRQNQVSMEELSGLQIAVFDDFPEPDEWAMREKRLLEDLATLPEQEILAVQKVILENKKYKEAAHELQISVNTLKTHLSRALSKLRSKHCLIYFF